jgi:hypothetical protein
MAGVAREQLSPETAELLASHSNCLSVLGVRSEPGFGKLLASNLGYRDAERVKLLASNLGSSSDKFATSYGAGKGGWPA